MKLLYPEIKENKAVAHRKFDDAFFIFKEGEKASVCLPCSQPFGLLTDELRESRIFV